MLDALPVGLCVLNRRGEVITINPPMVVMFGHTEQIGLPIPLRALKCELAVRLNAVIPRVLARRIIEENIDVIVRNSGDERLLLVSVFPLSCGSHGLVARDITDFHRAQEGRRQARRAEMIQQLAGGIAHDFNNLLTTILANASLIAESPQATGVADYAREILGAGERAPRYWAASILQRQ